LFESCVLFGVSFLFTDIIGKNFSQSEGLCPCIGQSFHSLPCGYTGAAGNEGAEIKHDLIEVIKNLLVVSGTSRCSYVNGVFTGQ